MCVLNQPLTHTCTATQGSWQKKQRNRQPEAASTFTHTVVLWSHTRVVWTERRAEDLSQRERQRCPDHQRTTKADGCAAWYLVNQSWFVSLVLLVVAEVVREGEENGHQTPTHNKQNNKQTSRLLAQPELWHSTCRTLALGQGIGGVRIQGRWVAKQPAVVGVRDGQYSRAHGRRFSGRSRLLTKRTWLC